jgi:predicted nucleic acid-binding Zn ribbon protein
MKGPKSITGIMAEEAARPEESAAAKVMAVLSLQQIWPEIVGELAGAHCRPAGFKKGSLVIASESPAWTQELSLLGPQIQERLDSALGKGVITELRFKTAKLPALKKRLAQPKKPAPLRKKPAPPPDPVLKARLEAELAVIKDPELRKVLMRVRLAAGR